MLEKAVGTISSKAATGTGRYARVEMPVVVKR